MKASVFSKNRWYKPKFCWLIAMVDDFFDDFVNFLPEAYFFWQFWLKFNEIPPVDISPPSFVSPIVETQNFDGKKKKKISSMESMSIGTQFCDSSNVVDTYPLYVMSWSTFKFNQWRVWYVELLPFCTIVIPSSIPDVKRIWHEHMGEPRVSYLCIDSVQDLKDIYVAC